MKAIITPTILSGNVDIPASKSLLHRAIIASCLAKGTSNIFNVTYSEDINATIEVMQKLGATIIKNKDNSLTIIGSKIIRKDNYINANESGSTLRFIIPLAILDDKPICFDGNNNLKKRPLDEYINIFKKQNIEYNRGIDYLPLKVNGKLKSDTFKIKGNISSQYITGLLFALPLLDKDSKIIIEGELESKSYIDLTLEILKLAKIRVYHNNYQEFIIYGNQSYQPFNYVVESDYSQAAFYLVANALGAKITINNLKSNSLQGDKKIVQDIEQICQGNATLSFKQTPDLFPIEIVLASFIKNKTTFIDLERLKIKESNRIESMVNNLKKLNANITYENNVVIVEGKEMLSGGNVKSYNDHRIVMALAIASIKMQDKLIINDAECIKKSYPNFFEDFIRLGGKVELKYE